MQEVSVDAEVDEVDWDGEGYDSCSGASLSNKPQVSFLHNYGLVFSSALAAFCLHGGNASLLA